MEPAHPRDEQIEAAVAALRGALGDDLLAVHLHGSAAARRLRPQSDIDLMAVVTCGLSDDRRGALLAALLRLSGRHPAVPEGSRCLDVIVFRKADLADAGFPARAEFTYGEWLRDAFEAGARSVPTRDPEHTLVLAQARQEAVPLFGPPAPELVPEIPSEQVRRAMAEALPALMDGLPGDERNVLLTLARMWHTARLGAFVPKDEAAAWALPRLREQDAQMLDHARRAYLGEIIDDWGGRDEAVRCLAAHLRRRVTEALEPLPAS